MRYLKSFKYNESKSDLASELQELIDAGHIPDKSYLYECFADLLDDGLADTDMHEISKDILDDVGISRELSAWWFAPFDWGVNIYTPPKGYSREVYNSDKSKNNFDDIISYHDKYNEIIEGIKSSIERIKLKYPNYNIEVNVISEPRKTKKGVIQLSIDIIDGYDVIGGGIRDLYKKYGYDLTGA